jgi:hypothetical protein
VRQTRPFVEACLWARAADAAATSSRFVVRPRDVRPRSTRNPPPPPPPPLPVACSPPSIRPPNLLLRHVSSL